MLRFYDLLCVSLRQVMRQIRRYLGVVFAISLGTAGFIVVISMGAEVKKNLNLDLDLLGGATLIKLSFEEYLPQKHRFSAPQEFPQDTIEDLRKIPGVWAISGAAVKHHVTSIWRNTRRSFMLFAVDEDFWKVLGILPQQGALFGREEVAGRRRICVVGEELALRVFGRLDVVGTLLPIDRDLYEVVGVVGGVAVGDRTFSAFIPLSTAMDRFHGPTRVERLYVRCKSWDDVGAVAAAIPAAVEGRQTVERLRLEVAWEHLSRVQRIAWWTELFVYLSIIATIVLGGFGIWNGMTASVQARTREIGLKKAMGAEDRDIMIQFLIESLCLSLGSAVLGVGIGRAAMEIMCVFLNSTPPEDLFLLCVGMGLAFSIIIGVGAGFYPSLRASRMEVVAAIRYE